jgi:membrane protein required for colicin V production
LSPCNNITIQPFGNMNYIDIILGLLLIVAAVRGFMKGFIYEVASLVALILGVWGGIHFSYSLARFLEHTFSWHSEHLGLISFFIILVVIVVLVHLVGAALSKVVEAISLGFLDHTAGLFFGLVKAAFILSILLVLLDRFDRQYDFIPEEDKEKSRTYEPLKDFVPTIFPFLNFWDERTPEKERKPNGKVV